MIRKKSMKKLLSILLSAAIIAIYFIPLNILAEEEKTTGITGGCTWTLEGTVLTISSNAIEGGEMYDFDKSPAPWGKDISKVIIKSNVKSIGEFAFYDCKNLKSITISYSVEEINSSAFTNCDSLESILIDSRNPVYHSICQHNSHSSTTNPQYR